jgi:DNA-binding transcriptional MocR family regulator
LQPAFANPTGVTLSAARREALLDVVKRAHAFVIEDDYARDLAFANAPPPPLFRDGGDSVVYVRSLTKSTAPGLRVAALVARGPVVRRLATMRATEDAFLSGLLQETALELVHATGWNAHVRAVRAELRRRRDVVVAALEHDWPEARLTRVPEGGFSLFVALPPGLDDVSFVEAAERDGVQITAGTPWFPGEKTGDYIRVSVAGASVDELERGVARLARCGEAMRGSRGAQRARR